MRDGLLEDRLARTDDEQLRIICYFPGNVPSSSLYRVELKTEGTAKVKPLSSWLGYGETITWLEGYTAGRERALDNKLEREEDSVTERR